MPSTVDKDPGETLDYVFDFAPLTNGRGKSNWLAAGETISSLTVTADSGITVESSATSDAATSVTVWLSGGTAYHDYDVTCSIVTTDSRVAERTMTVRVRNR